MNKVLIRFKSMITVNNETEKIEYEVEADYYKVNDLETIIYEEPSLDNVVNNVKVSYCNDEIMIERYGEHSNKMIFLREGKSFGTYSIDQMRMNYDIKINEMIVTSNKILLNYDLLVGADNVSLFEIEIIIKKYKEES